MSTLEFRDYVCKEFEFVANLNFIFSFEFLSISISHDQRFCKIILGNEFFVLKLILFIQVQSFTFCQVPNIEYYYKWLQFLLWIDTFSKFCVLGNLVTFSVAENWRFHFLFGRSCTNIWCKTQFGAISVQVNVTLFQKCRF